MADNKVHGRYRKKTNMSQDRLINEFAARVNKTVVLLTDKTHKVAKLKKELKEQENELQRERARLEKFEVGRSGLTVRLAEERKRYHDELSVKSAGINELRSLKQEKTLREKEYEQAALEQRKLKVQLDRESVQHSQAKEEAKLLGIKLDIAERERGGYLEELTKNKSLIAHYSKLLDHLKSTNVKMKESVVLH